MGQSDRSIGDFLKSAPAGPARDHLRRWAEQHEGARLIVAPPAIHWPFLYPLVPALPAGAPCAVFAPDLHEAFVNQQSTGTRLVTTQASFLLQAWLDAFGGRPDVVLLGAADPGKLRVHAPEAGTRRGPWADPRVTIIESASASPVCGEEPPASAPALLARAFRASAAAERLRLCVQALEEGRTAATLLAAASTCMEVNDLDAAARDLDEALTMATHWPAAHFERGKLWLRRDDMERASACFREAAVRMPGFISAWANFGAALGELDRPAEALAAFQRALALDPDSPQALNNVGVVSRELGQLGESEAAFRRVTQLVPNLAFGYYNLGHTLFLQGRYQAALSAYVDGQRRDTDRNPVQASRLAICRLATGDAQGALHELRRAIGGLGGEYKAQLLGDIQAVVWALLTHRPDLPGWAQVNDWLMKELRTKN